MIASQIVTVKLSDTDLYLSQTADNKKGSPDYCTQIDCNVYKNLSIIPRYLIVNHIYTFLSAFLMSFFNKIPRDSYEIV